MQAYIENMMGRPHEFDYLLCGIPAGAVSRAQRQNTVRRTAFKQLHECTDYDVRAHIRAELRAAYTLFDYVTTEIYLRVRVPDATVF